MRYYKTQQEFDSLNIQISDYQKSEIEKAKDRAFYISSVYPAEVVYSVSEHQGSYFNEHVLIRLAHQALDIFISHDGHKNKYHLVCWSFDYFRDIDYNHRSMAFNNLKEPNKIGVLTEKKILAWINYFEAAYAAMKKLNDTKNAEKNAFIATLKDLPVQWNKDRKYGRIEKNGIRYEFWIETSYINQKISFLHAVDSTLKNFLLLSDNNYQKHLI